MIPYSQTLQRLSLPSLSSLALQSAQWTNVWLLAARVLPVESLPVCRPLSPAASKAPSAPSLCVSSVQRPWPGQGALPITYLCPLPCTELAP